MINIHDQMKISVQDLGLPVRVSTALRVEGICVVGDLVKLADYEVLKIPLIGRKALREIEERLFDISLFLHVGRLHTQKPTDRHEEVLSLLGSVALEILCSFGAIPKNEETVDFAFNKAKSAAIKILKL